MAAKILIVEDEAITAMDLCTTLQQLGYEVVASVTSGEQAIEAAEKFEPELILMDIVLQGKIDGTQAAAYICSHQNIPIIFLTAFNDEATIKRTKPIGPYGYVVKPFDAKTLHMEIELALYKYKMDIAVAAEIIRIKNEFLANFSHEIRTPLTGIIGFSEIMNTEIAGELTPEQNKFVNNILISSKRLLEIIDSVLDLSTLKSQQMQFRPQRVDLNRLIREVIVDLDAKLTEKQIQLACEVDPSLTLVEIDPDKLKQIISCYLKNAIKFSQFKGKIEVKIQPVDDNQFRIEVVDYGIGISSEDIKKIFEPFQQLDKGFGKLYQGMGIELALTRRLVEVQGGHVGVNSTLGKGSTFYIVFPRTPLHDKLHHLNHENKV